MKWVYFLLLMIGFSDHLCAQETKIRQTICVLNYVPLLVESDPVIYQWNNQAQFEMGPGRISIRLATRQLSMEFDHLIQLNPPLPFQTQDELYLFLSSDSLFRNEKKISSKNSDISIIDTILTMGKSFFLRWKDIGGRVIQRVGFITHPLIPSVIAYRVNNYFDSLDYSLKARQFKRKTYIPIGYQKLDGDRIDVDPGGKLELKLQTHSLLTDTVVYYRLTTIGKSKDKQWKMTGHVLALPELIEGRDYDLELRYPNQSDNIVYHIHVRPFWYQMMWVQFAGLLLLILLVIFLTRHFYKRKYKRIAEQRQRLEEQLMTIQAQLNPHFIFNSLSSIEGLVSKGQNEEANHYLTIFSAIMRETLGNADKMLISLEEELVLIEKYIQIEQLRFGFQYQIDIQEGMPLSAIDIPPILIQPAIENAVKHGVAELGANGMIEIEVTQTNSSLFIKVINNSTVTVQSGSTTAGGHGLEFTHQKIRHLNALFPSANITFSLHIENHKATAEFSFHNWMA